MKNNIITMEMAQGRVNELYGEIPFWIKEWNGSKKPANILFGHYDAVEIVINRGEYLYREDRKKYVNNIILDSVQAHLDQQEKNMTLVSLDGLYKPAYAICHCCGSELKFTDGRKITSGMNKCINCKGYEKDKLKAITTEMTIQGIELTNRDEELKDLLCDLKNKISRYNCKCSSHEYRLGITEKVINSNKHIINREGIHEYFKERFQDDLWCAMEYEDDMLCA